MPVLKMVPSDDASAWLTIETGMTIIKIASNKTIRLTTIEMTMNDQKFLAEALKNPADEKVPDDPFRQLNNPPERKELIKNPTSIAMNKPLEK